MQRLNGVRLRDERGAYDQEVTASEWRVGPDQWSEAVAATDGYQVVVAGPGTGKTEFLVRRVAHILEHDLARRDEIVVLTFSRRAAADLRRRIDQAAGWSGVPIDVTTFHSLALRINETVADGPPPSPLTTPEQIAVVGEVLQDEDPEDWPLVHRGILETSPFATEVADFLMRCSERLLTPDDLAVLAGQRADWRGLPGLYRRYLDRLRSTGRTDYGVLLADAAATLTTPEGIAIAGAYRYVLVDEYQDTTPAQARIASLLASAHHNLTVTGDPYQSIFSFRGSELRNIADFTATHPQATRIVLTQSFRVPKAIMDSALAVVSTGDLPGAAGPVTPAPHAGRSEAYLFDQETAEAEWIAGQVERAIMVSGVPPSEIAVLVRSKRELLTELSRALRRKRIPHDPPDGRLVDHPAVVLIRDIITVAEQGGSLPKSKAVEAAAADRSMRRILLGPLIRLSLGRERELYRNRRRTWAPWSQVLREHLAERPGLIALISDAGWALRGSAAEGFWHFWNNLDGLEEFVADHEYREWRQVWTAFAQTLARQAERDPNVTLSDYLALTDNEDFEATPMIAIRGPEDRVVLTTLHQAKGLEFEIVFIANASEGVFPDLIRSRRMLRPELLSPEPSTRDHHLFALQEEMRLAYTAMTRARSRVVWTTTTAGGGLEEKRPSRFLLAAAGSEPVGPPQEEVLDPTTPIEAEIMLRRWLLDPTRRTVERLAAAKALVTTPLGWTPSRFAGVPAPGPDAPLLGETIRLSPSQAQSYEDCPRRYALERRLKLGEEGSPYARFGTLCHEVLERAEKEIIGTGAAHASPDRVMEILDEVWETADFGSPELNRAWRAKAVEMFTKLYNRWPGRGPTVSAEELVELEVDGVRWVGKIDRVERGPNGLRVVDLKTSTRAATEQEAAESLQLGFYVAARSSEHEPVVGASFWYPRNNIKSVAVRDFDMTQLDRIRERMRQITQSIREEHWEPRLGSQCTRCGFRNTCPIWPEGRGAYLP